MSGIIKAILLFSSVASVSAAEAALITYVFSGSLTQVSTSAPNDDAVFEILNGYGVTVGAQFQGSLTVESNTADVLSDDPDRSRYMQPQTTVTLNLGGLDSDGETYVSGTLRVNNLPSTESGDLWVYSGAIASFAPQVLTTYFDLRLTDASGTALASDAIAPIADLGLFDPYNPANPSASGLVAALLMPDYGVVEIRGRFESFATPIPVPAAGLLLLSGVTTLLFARRIRGDI
ncbi:MAG: hypothetical protein QNJ07_17020 [Woeseiaceae bacterium]|nr:hypothetical protein [Woeseiaceae bacterium]